MQCILSAAFIANCFRTKYQFSVGELLPSRYQVRCHRRIERNQALVPRPTGRLVPVCRETSVRVISLHPFLIMSLFVQKSLQTSLGAILSG